MSSTPLRQVLEHFQNAQTTVSTAQLARTLGIERTMLQEMIDYWVRKGKLREVGEAGCGTCGSSQGCPFVVALPRQYELVTDDSPAPAVHQASCGCSSHR